MTTAVPAGLLGTVPGATLHPFAVSTLPWESLPGHWSLTVCVKATYVLAPGTGEPTPSAEKDGFHEDVLYDTTPLAALYSPSDFVPYKPRADILLVGHAHAPAGAPGDSLILRVRVGDFSKALRVTGDRAWVDTREGPRASAPRPITRVPLRYDRAWRKGENLAGVAGGDTTRPPPNLDVVFEEGPAETPGFGPIAPSWRAQRDPRAQDALIWAQRLRGSPQQGPPPAGADPGIFNCAPRDQQVAEIAPGAPLVLDNLHARFPRLALRLPSLVPAVFHVEPATGRPREVAVRMDTLWIDTDREVFVVSWRGFLAIAPPQAAGTGRVLVAARPAGQAVTFEEVDALLRGSQAGEAPGSQVPGAPVSGRRAPARTSALPAISDAPLAPFPLAPAATTAPPASPGAAPIAGAPWAATPAAPVPKPSSELAGTMPLGASLAQFIKPSRKIATVAMQQVPVAPQAAPFPLAAPGAAPSAEPIAGAPWAATPAAPVPKPNSELMSTLPLGASLADAMAKAKAKMAGAPAPPAVVAPPAVAPPALAPPGGPPPFVAPPAAPAPPASVVAPPRVPMSEPPPAPPPPAAAPPAAASPAPAPVPVKVVWRVDAPEPAPPPPPPKAPPPPQGPDVRKQVYGDFSRKKR